MTRAGGNGGHGQAAPFFIVGSGRSGTTLLRLMLCGHSRLHIPPETWYIADLVQRFPLAGRLTAGEAEAVVAVMVGHYRWPDLGVAEAEFRVRVAALAEPRLRDIIDIPYAVQCERAGKPRWGDKTPIYIGCVPKLLELYPDARFINMIRDGRDVVVSYRHADFRGRSYHRDFEWRQAIRLAARWNASPLSERIMNIRYRDLVRDPRGTMEAICGFLGERFEEDMLRFAERAQEQVPERERHIHGKLSQPIRQSDVGAWRRSMTTLECFLVEASLHRELREAGYDLRFASPLWRPLFAATAGVMRLLAPVLDRAIPAFERRGVFRRTLYV